MKPKRYLTDNELNRIRDEEDTHFGQIAHRACEIIVDMTKESQEEIILREMESGSSSMIIWDSCR